MRLRQLRSGLEGLRQVFDQAGMRDARELTDRAFDLAASDADDEVARTELEAMIADGRSKGAGYALAALTKGRESTAADRTYRLLRAAVDHEPVRSLEPERAELLERIRGLHAAPVGEAFAQLAALAPALGRLAATVTPYPADQREQYAWFGGERTRVGKLVGPDAVGAAPLLRTHAAHQVVLAYLRIAAGNTDLGTARTSTHEIHEARLRAFEREGWKVEHLSGGRVRTSVSHTFGRPPDG